MESESIKRIYFRQSLRPKRPKNNFESQNIWTHPSNNQTRILKNGFSDLVSSLSFLIFALTLFIIILSGGAESAKRRTLSSLVCRHSRKKYVFFGERGMERQTAVASIFIYFRWFFLNEIEWNWF